MIVLFNYSLLNASTGSFFDAEEAGINPPIKVKLKGLSPVNYRLQSSN